MTKKEWLENDIREDWEQLAGEPLSVELVCETFYGLGSELATLRLLKAYRETEGAAQGWSENLKSFYFRLETNLEGILS